MKEFFEDKTLVLLLFAPELCRVHANSKAVGHSVQESSFSKEV